MHKFNKHIIILRTNNKRLSLLSQDSADLMLPILKSRYKTVEVRNIETVSDLNSVVYDKPDLVFTGLTYIKSGLEKIWVADYLDKYEITYTGSRHYAHMLEGDKSLAKQRVLDAGLSTSDFYLTSPGQRNLEKSNSISYPIFIKPYNRGGGMGVDEKSIAYNQTELDAKVLSIEEEFKSESIVESYLTGREFSVAVLKDINTDDYLTMPIELVAPEINGVRILGRKVKSSNTEEASLITDSDTKSVVSKLAIDVFHALGARDYGRIDIRMDSLGVPQFLEANLIPSLISGYGSFPKACLMNSGIDYAEMLHRIVDLGLARRLKMENPSSSKLAKEPALLPSLVA